MSAVPPQGGFLAGLGSLLGGGTTPEEQQRAAIFQAGLATLAGAQQPGATFGGALFGGLQTGAGVLQQAQQNAFQSKQLKNREEREDRLEKSQLARDKLAADEQARKDRERSAGAGTRFAAGVEKYKADPLGYYNVVSRDPDLQAAFQQSGIDPAAITTPQQVLQVSQQLGALGGIGADPARAQVVPSEIQEFQYYQSLSPKDRETYLQVKRNSQPYQLADSAGGQVRINRVTGEMIPVTSAAEEGEGRGVRAAGEASGKTIGEAKAAAKIDLPRIENNAGLALKAIEDLKSAPGLAGIYGVQGKFPNFPGGEAANAQARLDQVKGKTFLEAFNSLKGAGAITDVEGKKGEAAIARLDQAQSVEAAVEALSELQQVIVRGVDVARAKAAGPQKTQRNYSSMSDDDLKSALGIP